MLGSGSQLVLADCRVFRVFEEGKKKPRSWRKLYIFNYIINFFNKTRPMLTSVVTPLARDNTHLNNYLVRGGMVFHKLQTFSILGFCMAEERFTLEFWPQGVILRTEFSDEGFLRPCEGTVTEAKSVGEADLVRIFT